MPVYGSLGLLMMEARANSGLALLAAPTATSTSFEAPAAIVVIGQPVANVINGFVEAFHPHLSLTRVHNSSRISETISAKAQNSNRANVLTR